MLEVGKIKKAIIPAIRYGIIISIAATAIYLLNRNDMIKVYSPFEIKDYINSVGALAPVLYIIMFTFVPLTLFPDSILAIAGGMCFGLLWGSVYTIIGAMLGATLSFFIFRLIGRSIIKKMIKKDLGRLSNYIEEKGFFIVLMLRLIPLFPFDVISYSAGLSNIKYKDFLAATILGIIPGVFVFTNMGDKVKDIGSTGFYISISLLVFLFGISGMLKDRIFSKME